MPPIRRLRLFSAGFLAAFVLLPPSVRAASPAARVVSESATGLTLRISFPEPVRTEVELGGARFLSVQIPGLVSGSEAAVGSPDMPSRGFPFGLPEATAARIVRSTVLSTTSFQGLPPVPVPERSIVPGDPLPSQAFRHVANAEVYASARLFPEDLVSLGPVLGLRHQRVQSLIVRPVRVVPVSGAYEAVRELEVELRFEAEAGAPTPGRRQSVRTDAPGWEETYDRLLVNPSSARSFRTRPAPTALEPAIGPGDTYLRIRLGGSGLCRVPYADLAAEGWPAGIALGDVRVEERGFNKQLADPFTVVSLPRRVEDTNTNGIFDSGDYLVFHGLNYRDRFNPPTITEARYTYFHTYWVTASGGVGTDWAVVDGFPADTGYVAVTSFLQSEHFEQNLTYINNPKDSLPYIYPIYDALYWLLSNQKVVDLPFTIGDPAPGGVFRVRARWQGVNTALATRTHVAALDLNQQVLLPESQATTFCDLEPFLWEGTFQPMAGMLTAGQNTLTVKTHVSDNPSGCAYGQSQNQFSGALFDWFDIIYERMLVARNDQLTFNSGSATGRIELAVPGFTSPDILVLDITDPVGAFVLTPNIVQNGGTYTATIRVTVGSSPRKFIALVRDSVSGLPTSVYTLPTDLGTKAIARGLPRDLLAEGEGSDYILITHPTFREAWQPLVDHRQDLGHNVFVCDVWEVYDQFAGGDKTPWAIQRFLQQAFRNWDPSPSFVLLGADANEDYRGDTPESNPDWLPTQMHFGAVPGTSGPELAGTDAWYVQFLRAGDPEYDVLPDMNYGRIPAGSVAEVTDFVQKALAYEAMSPADDWRRRGLFLADDQYSSGILSGAAYCWQSGEQTFRTTTQAVIDSIHVLAGLDKFRTDVVLLSAHLDSVAALNRDPGPGDCPGASVLAATTNYTRTRVTPGVIDSLSRGYVIWEFTGHANRSRMTHEVLFDHSSLTLHDMDKILNFGKPFLFMGYACHLMEYEYAKEATGPNDNIGEALLMAPNRGAIGVFASSSYEWLPTNPLAQLYTTRPLFWNLPRDPSGRPRRLWGEAMTRGIVQLVTENPTAFGVLDMPRTYQVFGDPAQRIDAYLSVWSSILVNGEPWTEGQSLTSPALTDTVDVSAVVGDDVDIASIRAWAGTTPIPSSQITVIPPAATQEGLQPYQVHLRVPPLQLGTYSIRLEATDWAGVTSSLELPVAFETAFQADGRPTGDGETVDRAATIAILVSSPVPLAPGNFSVVVDSTTREDVVPTGGPNDWQINVPGPWTEGQHHVALRVSDPNATCVPGGCPLVRSLGFQVGGPPLDQVYFYPNPVEAEEGVFLYRLGANGHNAQVSIYSLSGRRIRRDDSPALAGLNSYRWDLRDEKGDRVANGVYLFVLRVEGQDGDVITNASSPEKVAITR